MTTRFPVALGAIAGAATLLLTACSGAGASPEASNQAQQSSYDCAAPNAEGSLRKVTVSAQPIVSNGALYAGVDEGFFEKHGLELEIQPVANVAASIASVQGGTSDFGFATTVSILQAVDNGVPINIIAPFAGIAPQYYEKMQAGEEGYTTEITAIVAKNGLGIDSPQDLEGHTVAVVDSMGQAELTTRYTIRENGGDDTKVQYTVMSFPDALNAFKADQVDAIFTVEPFLNQALAANGTIISWPGVETFHEGPTSAIISSSKFVAEQNDTVTRMNCALREADEFANEQHDVIRAAVAQAQNVDPATLADATVPYFYTSMDLQGLARFSGIMHEFGFIKTQANSEELVIPQAVAE